MIYLLKRIIAQLKSPYLNKEYRRVTIVIFFIFLSSYSLCSQNSQQKIPLIDILKQLEQNSSFQFTYANATVANIKVAPPPQTITFKEKIRYLENKTKLVFQFINDNFIAIKTSNEVVSICGYIFDKESNMALEAVAVLSSNQQTITDSSGYFKTKIAIADDIEIRYLGFKPISLKVESFKLGSCQNIYLEPDIESLSEIILPNLIAAGINKVADGSLIIDYSNFGILPGLIETDVLQTIQVLPGIQSANETVSDINIRGGTNDQNMILWDGIKMYQTGHFFGLISAFNPQITNSAQVIKNGTSVDYSDGVSGTILMKTDRKLNESFSTSLGLNFINADFFTDIPTSHNSSLQIAGRKAISNLFNTPTYTSYFNRIQQDTEIQDFTDREASFDFYDTSLRWLYNITEKDELRANFIYINNGLSFLESAEMDNGIESRLSKLEQNTLASSLYYKREWNSNLTTTLQITNSEYELGANNVDVSQESRLVQVNKVEETSTKLNSWFTFNDRLSLMSGYQFVETAVNNLTDVDDPLFIRLVREVIREHSFYSQLNYQLNKTNVKIGARYNYISKFDKHIIEPRLSINHKFTKAFSMQLLGEFKHQNTMQIINFQNDFFGVEKRRWFLSNDSSRPVIKSRQVSLGANYKKQGWLIGLDSYIKNVSDISAQSQGFLNQYIFSEAIGSYDVYGIELLINKKINNVSTWLSYTYADNQYNFKELEEVNFPNNLDINHSITFGTAYEMNNLKISAGLNWHTGIPTTTPVANNEIIDGKINYESANNSNLDDYLRLDASATYKFNLTKKVKAQTGVSLWNISNVNNTISTYYTIDENEQINEVINSALELTPNFSFRVLF